MLKVVVIAGFNKGFTGLIAETIVNQSLVDTAEEGTRIDVVGTRAIDSGIESAMSNKEGIEITGVEIAFVAEVFELDLTQSALVRAGYF